VAAPGGLRFKTATAGVDRRADKSAGHRPFLSSVSSSSAATCCPSPYPDSSVYVPVQRSFSRLYILLENYFLTSLSLSLPLDAISDFKLVSACALNRAIQNTERG